jgi:hypothetical protein
MTRHLGRIRDVITQLETKYKKDVFKISEKIKLDMLCHTLQLSYAEFDHLIFSNSPVMRTVKGHAFESYFDELMTTIGENVIKIGGDVSDDRILRKNSLQLKTPYKAGSKGDLVSYKTHKTHGAKSERESLEYYSDISGFSDYLVGLVSYIPLNILILKKEELPRHPLDNNKILSPFKIIWKTHCGLNAWNRIGVSKIPSTSNLLPSKNERLKETAGFLNMNTDVIVNTILSNENFRIWDMSIRGFARESVFTRKLKDHGIEVFSPQSTGKDRAEKADHAIRKNANTKFYFFQMKGASINNCKFDGLNSTIATETQLTRGRVNDHPTQSRLYLATDFDYLVIGLDPALSYEFDKEVGRNHARYEWQFFCIPSKILKRHNTLKRRFKSLQSFKYLELGKYKVDDYWLSQWETKL